MTKYSNPTANAAIGAVEREMKKKEKKIKYARELYQQGKLSDDMKLSLYREFRGIYKPLLKGIFIPFEKEESM